MNGYFSRLMEQSGITVGSAVNPGSGERDAVLPTRVDQEERVESRREDPTAETQEGSEAEPDISGSVVRESVRAEQALRREAPQAPHRPPEEGQRGRQERRELAARDPEQTLPWRPERGGVVEGDAGRPGAFGREALKRDETIEGATHRADERSSGAKASGEESQDRTSRERIWQDTLRGVRGWVAQSPVADDGGAEDRDVSRANTTSINTDSPFVEERAAASYPKSTAPSPREEPATQDLRLEIETISVTVEEPQKEIPKSSRRTGSAEKKTAVNNERSRLSRHYVRVR